MNVKVVAVNLIAIAMVSTSFLCNLEEDAVLADTK